MPHRRHLLLLINPQLLSLYLLILPLVLVEQMGWKMIGIVTACAFTMMGIEHIAAQVEMPFGTYVLLPVSCRVADERVILVI